MTTGGPSHSASVPSHLAMVTGGPSESHTTVVTGGHSLSTMATRGPSHSARSNGGPSHWADFLMVISADLPMGMTGALPFSTTSPIIVSSSVTLSVVACVHPPAVFSLPVSNSDHTSTGQVVVNGTRVSINIATSNPSPHQAVDRRSQGAFSSPTSCKEKAIKPFPY